MVLDIVPQKVIPSMKASLPEPYTHEEVKNALFQMCPMKAPGPDGFRTKFFQCHWDICSD